MCYTMASDKLGFEEAAAHCESMDAGLVSIHNQSQNDFLYHQFGNGSNIRLWLGGVFLPSQNTSLVWLDLTEFNFMHPSLTIAPNQGDSYIFMYGIDGYWELSLKDSNYKHPFLCGLRKQKMTQEILTRSVLRVFKNIANFEALTNEASVVNEDLNRNVQKLKEELVLFNSSLLKTGSFQYLLIVVLFVLLATAFLGVAYVYYVLMGTKRSYRLMNDKMTLRKTLSSEDKDFS